jgi:pimeloyl-ACP methyl ester carboxylesterase
MDYLALRGYDVYALDMRGMGMSTRPANYFTIGLPERVGDVAAAATYILTATGRQPVIIGHSQGAWVTTLLAASHPELVAGIGLSGMPGNGLYTPPELIALLEAVIASGADRIALPPEIAYLLAFGYDPVTGSPTVNAETFETFYAMLEADSIPAIAAGTRDSLDLNGPALTAVQVPALVVDGAYDFSIGEARATALYNALGSQQKQLLIFPRNTHFWFLEDNFHSTMRAFDEFLSAF